MAIPLSYNLRSMVQRPVSAIATLVGVGLVVAILIGALALASGFQTALVATGSPDNVMVLRRGADSEISSGIGRDATDVIRALPDVATGADGRPLASPEVVVLINLERLGQPGSSNVTVRGIEADALALRREIKIVEGRRFMPGSAEVIAGRRLGGRFVHCALGDHIRFGTREFNVVGRFTAGGSGFESEIWGENAVLMPVFRGDVFQSITFRMKNPQRFPEIKRLLERDPRLHVDVRLERRYYEEQSQMMAVLMRVAGVFVTGIMAVGAVFGAMNTMFAAVNARNREIATLLALGFSPFAVLSSFLVESVLLALAGGVLGCLLALPINGITTSTTNFSTFSELAFAFRVTPAALTAGLVFSAALGVVGGIFPAWRASRRPLAQGLREA